METFGRNQQFSKNIDRIYECIWIFFSTIWIETIYGAIHKLYQSIHKKKFSFFAKRMDMGVEPWSPA